MMAKTSTQKFTSPRSREVMAKIRSYLERNKTGTIKNFRAVTNLSDTQTALYVRHMIEIGDIHCAAPDVRRFDAKWEPAIYMLGTKDKDQPEPDFQRQVVRITKWPPNHVRDMLHCYLFGTPDAMKTT